MDGHINSTETLGRRVQIHHYTQTSLTREDFDTTAGKSEADKIFRRRMKELGFCNLHI